jgi:hypothetical protein
MEFFCPQEFYNCNLKSHILCYFICVGWFIYFRGLLLFLQLLLTKFIMHIVPRRNAMGLLCSETFRAPLRMCDSVYIGSVINYIYLLFTAQLKRVLSRGCTQFGSVIADAVTLKRALLRAK